MVSIKGSLKNTTGRDLTYAQITFALYDDDGAQIGTAVANINNLEKDGIWKYSATPMTMESWSQYKLTDIDCF
ncbi:FxLYD domain-containing protein [Pseudobutyrivibrio sp. ACV-2]|uniref:FxLYD domain-containing protein n=1 Tax=Pseudobutyrivibrio sp. ACV-2 TaxID=1520801 RepID=UPI00111508E7|nr:FxLYD domain-containing protein [Pseudobutyrivibrio sp. ACV-2]